MISENLRVELLYQAGLLKKMPKRIVGSTTMRSSIFSPAWGLGDPVIWRIWDEGNCGGLGGSGGFRGFGGFGGFG